MRVTRLEIFGFKSFVDRFVLNFDKNMIGIVGPNGCGKSNVVDALRWVLGETHAKQLRGGSFDDLIFNGSDSRRQLGMAEVSLTICPEPNWKSKIEEESPDLGELKSLDKSLTESFSITDSEISEPEQIDISVANDSDFADSNRTEGEQKNSRLDLLGTNVMAIPGLFESSEIQFTRRLYRSGESEFFINKAACRLRDMQDLYRLIGLGARGLSIVQQGQIGQFISKKPVERRELLEEAAGISGFRNKMEAASRRLEKTDENLARVADILIEVEKQVKSLRRQASRARARQSLKEELTLAEKELYGIKSSRLGLKIENAISNIESLTQEIETIKAGVAEKDSGILEIEAALHEVEVQLMSLRREKDEHSRTLIAEENKLQETRVKLATLDSNKNHLIQREEQDNLRLAVFNEDLNEYERTIEVRLEDKYQAELLLEEQRVELTELEKKHALEIEAFQSEQTHEDQDSPALAQMNLELRSLTQTVEELEQKIEGSKDTERQLNEVSKNLKLEEQGLINAEKVLTKIRSESQAIEKQLASLANHTLQAVSGTNQTEEGRVVLSLFTIPAHLERAVHAVLGEKANFLVVNDSDDKLQSYLSSKTKSARLGVVNGGVQQTDFTEELDITGVSRLLSHISFSESDKALVSELLGDVWYAESVDAALLVKNQLRSKEYSIVLSGGEVLTPWGWYTTEGEGLHFSFTRRKAELLAEEEKQVFECDRLRENLKELEQTYDSLKTQVQMVNEDKSRLFNEQRKVSSLLKQQGEEEKLRYQQIRDKEHQLRQSLREIEKSKSKEVVALQEQVYSIGSDLASLQAQAEKLNKEKDKLLAQIAEYPEKLAAIEVERERLYHTSSEASEAANSLESVNRRERVSELEKLIEEEEKNRLTKHQAVSEIKLELSDLRKKSEELYSALRSFESEKDRAEIELDMLKQDYARYYPEEALESLDQINRDQLNELGSQIDARIKDLVETSNSIRKRLEREGEVDPQSIELCEQEEARLESMTVQHKDLILAKETLERTIKQLKELSKIRFLNTFAAVNTKFKELVPRLFSGGSGYLELVNPEDPLQSGVEIVVRPPGKKITTMELMSGGEKALVATAVLVSVFLHHPGPICVLDEIDAPLDDANLIKLLDLVKEIADRTQFLVITHNKITMQAVERLIGITMQESGVTTALSVTLDEAEKELDRMAVNA